jgi:hypothetical protein
MNVRSLVLTVAFGLFAAGCIRTAEMPLAPNVVRLDTQASGLLYTGQAPQQTMRRAAELTLQNGYTHFRIEQAQMSQGSQFAGSVTSGSGSVYGGRGYATYNATAFSTPVYAPTSSVGATVVMFRSNERGAQGAFDAQQVLAGMSR